MIHARLSALDELFELLLESSVLHSLRRRRIWPTYEEDDRLSNGVFFVAMRTVDQNISAVVPLLGSAGVCPVSGVGIVCVSRTLHN